jgi:hypothetical protein
MSLRSTILTHSLPLLPTYSFTRQTLTHALSSLPPDHASYRPEPLSDSVVDTLFGPGPSAGKALVEAWEDEGLSRMDKGKGVGDMLERRLSYSAEVGEHLVEVGPPFLASYTLFTPIQCWMRRQSSSDMMRMRVC